MNRNHFPALLGTALLATLAACQPEAEQAPPAEEAPAATVSPASPEAAAAPAAQAGGLLDPEQATREELLAIPGFDAALADSLIAGRPYADMTEVDQVLGGRLSEPQRDSVYTRLWKPLDLNNASAQEILLIPGVGGRMQHEFEEYRPYRNIEQFRREIGKYVDGAEVARLERYVTIR
ncbi:MAG TPA: hypothetical protein VHG51_13340 [Longimicrobiaceae bacterium]|nr:hypothetical protein [Longimicrobiaceae bacterium]